MSDRWSVQSANQGASLNGWPKVTIVHSFYRSTMPSGENATVLRQYRALANLGVDVSLLSVSTDSLATETGYTLRTAVNVARGSGLSPVQALNRLAPGVIHIHNLFPNIATTWLKNSRIPIVTTLHNYRSLCAAATLSREGIDCTLCVDGSAWNSLRHRCYRHSALATLPMTIRALPGIPRQPLLRYSDVLLAPSELVRRTYASAGVDRVRVLLQPTSDRGPIGSSATATHSIFVGRLSSDKGITELLVAWPRQERLVVVGEGPQEVAARAIASSRGLEVIFRQSVPGEELSALIRGAHALVCPSTWREAAPAVYAEALSAGTPLIAVPGNAVADLVAHDATGVVIPALTTEALTSALSAIADQGDLLRAHCYGTYQRDYTFQVWEEQLRIAYAAAATHREQSINSR